MTYNHHKMTTQGQNCHVLLESSQHRVYSDHAHILNYQIL